MISIYIDTDMINIKEVDLDYAEFDSKCHIQQPPDKPLLLEKWPLPKGYSYMRLR